MDTGQTVNLLLYRWLSSILRGSTILKIIMIYYFTKETFKIKNGLNIFNLYNRTGDIIFRYKTAKSLISYTFKIKRKFRIFYSKTIYETNTTNIINETHKIIL